jgi:hypothetical protein
MKWNIFIIVCVGAYLAHSEHVYGWGGGLFGGGGPSLSVPSIRDLGASISGGFKTIARQGKNAREDIQRQGKAAREGVQRQGKNAREDIQRQGKAALEGVQRQGKNAREDIQRQGKAAREGVQRQGKNAREDVERQGKAAREGVQRQGKNAREDIQRRGKNYWQPRVAAVAAAWHKDAQKVTNYGRQRLYSLFMQSPQYIKIEQIDNQRLVGDPVYYVNGMLTPREVVINEAQFLASEFRRPVYVILNPSSVDHVPTGTPGCADDVAEAIYDKFWPETVTGLTSLPSELEAIAGGVTSDAPFSQLNITTRQVTSLIFNTERPISIVSHSQGCLQVRNALIAVSLLGHESRVTRDLAWVATGSPVNRNELWPEPAKYNHLNNNNDPAAVWIGGDGGPGSFSIQTFSMAGHYHEPTRNYFPHIDRDMLFAVAPLQWSRELVTEPRSNPTYPNYGLTQTVHRSRRALQQTGQPDPRRSAPAQR